MRDGEPVFVPMPNNYVHRYITLVERRNKNQHEAEGQAGLSVWVAKPVVVYSLAPPERLSGMASLMPGSALRGAQS